MDKVTLPGLPERRAADYQLDGFDPPRYARVVYTPQESKPAYALIEAQAFEVDTNGVFQSAPNGTPSRSTATKHTVQLAGVGDTHTLLPGWVRVVGTYDINNLPEGTQILDTLPESGTESDRIWCNNKLYRWSLGMVEEIMRGKAAELAGVLRNSAAMENFGL
jgi:hypothetical protein